MQIACRGIFLLFGQKQHTHTNLGATMRTESGSHYLCLFCFRYFTLWFRRRIGNDGSGNIWHIVFFYRVKQVGNITI